MFYFETKILYCILILNLNFFIYDKLIQISFFMNLFVFDLDEEIT